MRFLTKLKNEVSHSELTNFYMPDTTTITCPKCGERIPFDGALTKEMGESMRIEYKKKMESERATMKLEAEKKAREEAGAKFKDLVLAKAFQGSL